MARPEIVIGLVGALGTDLGAVAKAIEQVLSEMTYNTLTIRLSQVMKDYLDHAPIEGVSLIDNPRELRLKSYMDAGNAVRKAMGNGDALAQLTIAKVRKERASANGGITIAEREQPLDSQAYLLQSLKHPDEVRLLRDVYGPSFFLISAYAPKQQRLAHLADQIVRSHNRFRAEEKESEALALVNRDEEETDDPLGQKVRETFWRGDAYIDATIGPDMEKAVRRVIQLWFGHPFHTPTREEYLMFVARAAAYRSASLGRQVGAVIATADGSIISTGTNEVPKAGGGQYWDSDEGDARDHINGYDSSDFMRQELLGDILERLQPWLTPDKQNSVQDQVKELLYGDNPIMKGAEFNALTEFQRPVHAEMSALIDAARRGVAVQDATLYSTTFPCHGCARHIVAAGIRRVVYIEPYAKSLARTLHSDSLSVDQQRPDVTKVRFEPFVGLAPRRYLDCFAMGTRKDKQGEVLNWSVIEARPHLKDWAHILTVINEQNTVYALANSRQEQKRIEIEASSTEEKGNEV
jgi:deoxycytidylate deaminase